MRSKNPRDVAYIFRDYARKIHARSTPDDPSFIKLAAACGKVSPPHPLPLSLLTTPSFQIERWCEDQYPSFLNLGVGAGGFNQADQRSALAEKDNERLRQQNLLRKQKELLEANADVVKAAQALREKEEEGAMHPGFYIAAAFAIVFATGIIAVYGLIWAVDNVEWLK